MERWRSRSSSGASKLLNGRNRWRISLHGVTNTDEISESQSEELDAENAALALYISRCCCQKPLQEDMRHINPKLQNSETQVTTTLVLEHLMDKKELSPQSTSDSEETVNVATLKSVEFDEFSIVDEYLSEPEETLEVSSHKPDITIAHNKDDKVDKEISHFRKAGGAANRERGRPTSGIGETTHPP
ncbi:hypothetical protein Scep_004263 [Stephania cephalantha]|uniref:Uncharacterized protein n=1 Tax=Stephania cephalantha TaxID=152367 RepID=A0AAP0PX49_9MAGN